jgi:VIT1/CCC1 family predicted Fe2+/Mn2+ transporter
MPTDPEQERLRRLRDRQLAARDPQTKARKLHSGISSRQRQSVEPFSLVRIWSEIPHMWRYAFYGFTLGVVSVALLPLIWPSPWAVPCSVGATLMLAIFGVFIGRAADTRDSLKELMK